MSQNQAAATSIDLTPTWGEIGNLYRRLAETGEVAAITRMASEFAKAMAAAQALTDLLPSLTDDQTARMKQTIVAELTKQGFPPPVREKAFD